MFGGSAILVRFNAVLGTTCHFNKKNRNFWVRGRREKQRSIRLKRGEWTKTQKNDFQDLPELRLKEARDIARSADAKEEKSCMASMVRQVEGCGHREKF